MIFANFLFGTLYLVVDLQYRKHGWFDDRSYYVVYALGYNNKITGFGVPKEEITNLFSFLNWKLVQ
jgi:hypothetical protein